MDLSKFIEVLAFTLPAVVTGLVAFYFFRLHVRNEDKRRNFLIQKEAQKIALPLRLQAYERLTLFLERISPAKLLLRVKPTGKDPDKYAQKLIQIIEQELEHNLAQQVYVSETAWKAVLTSKNVTIKMIRGAVEKEEVQDPATLQQDILQTIVKIDSPNSAALAFLRLEVQKMF